MTVALAFFLLNHTGLHARTCPLVDSVKTGAIGYVVVVAFRCFRSWLFVLCGKHAKKNDKEFFIGEKFSNFSATVQTVLLYTPASLDSILGWFLLAVNQNVGLSMFVHMFVMVHPDSAHFYFILICIIDSYLNYIHCYI